MWYIILVHGILSNNLDIINSHFSNCWLSAVIANILLFAVTAAL